MDDSRRRARWRLILGTGAEQLDDALQSDALQSDALQSDALQSDALRRDRALAFLYDREYDAGGRNVRGTMRGADLDPARLTVPDWINAVHELFPRAAVARIERDALERYRLQELVTNPDLLRRAQPSTTLLKAILRTKHLMNADVLALARRLVARVVRELEQTLARDVRRPFAGVVNPRTRSRRKIARNFDARATVARNLRYYDRATQQLTIREPLFNARIQRRADQWQLIILVDQSGSMLDSVIHAAVSAAIFHGIRSLRTHLIAFDTAIVDLTQDVGDPVTTLMQLQLGGGTDIGQALAYAGSLIDQPQRTLVVLISDLFEGAPTRHLLAAADQLVGSGVTLLALAALDRQARPAFNPDTAQALARLGAHVGAMTPGELAAWVAETVR